jgi:hypothetical protein
VSAAIGLDALSCRKPGEPPDNAVRKPKGLELLAYRFAKFERKWEARLQTRLDTKLARLEKIVLTRLP